jgi:hypothetical protein
MTDYRQFKATPDPAMIAAKKQNTTTVAKKPTTAPVAQKTPTTATPAILAQTPASKPAPLPMVKIEQTRNNAKTFNEIPMEVDVKSQSVAI